MPKNPLHSFSCFDRIPTFDGQITDRQHKSVANPELAWHCMSSNEPKSSVAVVCVCEVAAKQIVLFMECSMDLPV